MPFAAALSEHPVPAVAVGAAVGDVVERLGSAPDVAVLFVTPHHVGALEDIAAAVQTLLDPTAFIGATAVAVLVGERGVEDGPGLALWTGRLAGAVTPVHLTADQSEDGWHLDGLPGEALDRAGSLVLVADPFTFPVSEVLQHLRSSHPELPVTVKGWPIGRQPCETTVDGVAAPSSTSPTAPCVATRPPMTSRLPPGPRKGCCAASSSTSGTSTTVGATSSSGG